MDEPKDRQSFPDWFHKKLAEDPELEALVELKLKEYEVLPPLLITNRIVCEFKEGGREISEKVIALVYNFHLGMWPSSFQVAYDHFVDCDECHVFLAEYKLDADPEILYKKREPQ